MSTAPCSGAMAEAADANRRASDIEIKSNGELMAKDKYISELVTKIRVLKGEQPFAAPFPHKRENSAT